MARKRKLSERIDVPKLSPTRAKLDPRLSLLLALPTKQRHALKAAEDARIGRLARQIEEATAARDRAKGSRRARAAARLRKLDRQFFAPLTAGLYFPQAGRGKRGSIAMQEPFFSAFILSDASADDLKRLGVHVRSRVGDIFSGFIPQSAIGRLEQSSAIRYIELTRPLFNTLDEAVPYAQIDKLHNAVPPFTGKGVIIGIIDKKLDIYHQDFRTATGATRVLFLWDQDLSPQGTEAGPPVGPALPGFVPKGGMTYGVEYCQTMIDEELHHPSGAPAYQIVRHKAGNGSHGTHVTGIAAGNGLAEAGTYTGAAPAAGIIFVHTRKLFSTDRLADMPSITDAFAYIFARATQLGLPCVVNLSNSDNQGPHDGTLCGEQFLDGLLLTPGRAITLSAGNSNYMATHATGRVASGGTADLVLEYKAGATESDDVEIWYDGHDRFDVTVTIPTSPPTVIGPVPPGTASSSPVTLPNGVRVQVTSMLNDVRNGDNFIQIFFVVPAGQSIPEGKTNISLTGTTVINGMFHAWLDRNNQEAPSRSAFLTYLKDDSLTLGIPATARRPITVGNHDKMKPTPLIQKNSGRGPSRDGRIKPEVATVGTNVMAPNSHDRNDPNPSDHYTGKTGTSMSAPLVAGACACLLECRNGAGTWTTWANLKQILADSAGTSGLTVPGNDFGYGYLQVGAGCAAPLPSVDVWLRHDAADAGAEPFTGPVAWLSPDIEVLGTSGNPVPNPTFDPVKRFNSIIRITVRNRGTNAARNTEIYFYWADPATNIPYPDAWNTSGIYNDAPGFVNQSNMIVIPHLAAGASTQVLFGWAPPAPAANLRGDDHFCLLVRLENASDAAQVGSGGWSVITAHNNIAARNVHVRPYDANGHELSFYVVGSADQASLIVHSNLAGGKLSLLLPVQALPWRDIRLIERNKGPRAGFGYGAAAEPLARAMRTLKGEERICAMTDIVGADLLELRDGIARVTMGRPDRMHLPFVRIAHRARMAAKIDVSGPKIDGKRRFVHVAQYSGGQLIGGVSLELRPRKNYGRGR